MNALTSYETKAYEIWSSDLAPTAKRALLDWLCQTAEAHLASLSECDLGDPEWTRLARRRETQMMEHFMGDLKELIRLCDSEPRPTNRQAG